MHIRTDCEDIYEVSRAIFFAFAKSGKALLEMALKKVNLEDVFLELTDSASEQENSEGKQEQDSDGNEEDMGDITSADEEESEVTGR